MWGPRTSCPKYPLCLTQRSHDQSVIAHNLELNTKVYIHYSTKFKSYNNRVTRAIVLHKLPHRAEGSFKQWNSNMRRCRGIVESSRGRGAIELGRERGFGDVGCSGDGVTKSLPSFGSRNGGETLRAAIIHYKAISPSYSGSRLRLYLCVCMRLS